MKFCSQFAWIPRSSRGMTKISRGTTKRQQSLIITTNLFLIVSCGSNAGIVTNNQIPDTIVFSPSVVTVNNPTVSTVTLSQQSFTINMGAFNAQGQPLTPTPLNPIHVDVYGAPNGMISPTSTTSTGSVTFTYSGGSFPNNITINAWMSDSANNAYAIGVTQVLKQNTPPCAYGSTSYQVPLVGTLPNALQVMADVGYNTSSPLTTLTTYTVDTGSLGVVVPSTELPQNGNVIGPGASGVKYYDSSGNTYSGHYYLAPVRLQLQNGVTVQTQPIMVLGINSAYCTGPTSKSCYSNPPKPNLHYLGVGFNRTPTSAADLFNSPTANAFLHITNANNGTDMSPGYTLTPGDRSTATGLTLGITNATGYNIVNLTSNPATPGDFNAQPGCYSFPNLPAPNQFCGTALLDVGIDSMFIDLPKSQWPVGSYDANSEVPAGVNMSVLMGNTNSPAMSYNFSAVQGNPPNKSPAPTQVQWIDSSSSGLIFVNTGRRPLYNYDYMYNGQCGQVGFFPLP